MERQNRVEFLNNLHAICIKLIGYHYPLYRKGTIC